MMRPSCAKTYLGGNSEILFRHTVIQYVFSRENYSWEGVNANYLRASAMSAPG